MRRMTKTKYPKVRHPRRKSPLAAIALLFLYALLCVAYVHLPERAREPIATNARGLNRQLYRHGNAICDFFDNLGLWGHDQAIALDKPYDEEQVYGGWPKQKLITLHRANLLENRGYSVGYSEYYKTPVWAAYRVFDVPKMHSGKRPSHFTADARIKDAVTHNDYTRSGFDRGHMAPNFAIATRYGRAAQQETFLMSNIIPQAPQINRHIWKDLEMKVARTYGRYFGEVWVITGPIFEARFPERLDSGVAIPDSYYKIIADESGQELRVLAFIMDKDCPPYTRLKSHLVSVDDIEAKTGLDFFSDLPDETEAELEALPAKRLWPTLLPAIRYHLGQKPDVAADSNPQ